jgi:CCR4-NOT transcription complex subunit 7/8
MAAFGERLTASGLVLNDEVKWIAFHGMYDFAYMLKLLTGAPMPVGIAHFEEALDTFFRCRLDLKWHFPKGSLSKLGEKHGLRRRGTAHQGGSDALLTLDLFFCCTRARDIEDDGRVFGLHESSHSSVEDGFSRSASCNERILAARHSAARERGNVWDDYGYNPIHYGGWVEYGTVGHSSGYDDQYHWSEPWSQPSQVSSHSWDPHASTVLMPIWR